MEEHGGTPSAARELVTANHRSGPLTNAGGAGPLGPWLRQHREALGVTVEQVALFLKVQPFYVEALEAEAFRMLPGRAYAVGYVRSMAHALGIDSGEAVVRLQSAWPYEAEPLPKPTAKAIARDERRFPVRLVVSLAVAVSIAGYAYWYVDKSAEMGRPLLSPVAELEAPADDADAPAAEPKLPSPGPLQLLGVPELAQSSDAADAIGDSAEFAMMDAAGHRPLPAAHLPRPRPGTDAAEQFAATYTLPVPDALAGPASTTPASTMPVNTTVATAAGAGSESVPVHRLPERASLDAYLPTVGLRSDLGPLRGAMRVPAFMQAGRTAPEAVEPAMPAIADRTQAFAAVPRHDDAVAPSPATAERRQARLPAVASYDPMTALRSGMGPQGGETAPAVTIHADQPCWIEIRDTAGKALVQRLLQPGDRLNVPAKPGLTLTAGNAGGIRILVAGTAAAAIGATGEVVRGVSLNAERLLERR